MRIVLFIALSLLTSIPYPALADEVHAQQTAVKRFYSVILGFREPGLPSKQNIEKLSPCISRDLRALLLQAFNAEERYRQKNQGTVPPLVESHLFYSLFEGAQSFGKIARERGRGKASFLVELTYRDPYGRHEKIRWKDRVVLTRENNRWVVNDIEYLGTWAFGDKGSVRSVLRSVTESAGSARSE